MLSNCKIAYYSGEARLGPGKSTGTDSRDLGSGEMPHVPFSYVKWLQALCVFHSSLTLAVQFLKHF